MTKKIYNKQILIFDSGVGGLSVTEQIRSLNPSVGICYLADNECFPYGLMTEQSVIDRVVRLISLAIERYTPDLIVIACNTASTLVLPHLRALLNIPVVGVVPAIKPAAQLSNSKVIGLLATPGTIQRQYTDELIRDFAADCEVVRVGSSELVEAIEANIMGNDYDQSIYARVMADFHQHTLWPKLDTIVLACTHFPLATAALSAEAPHIKHWVDSGEAIARRVEDLLAQSQYQRPPATITETAAFTGRQEFSDSLCHTLKRYGFQQLEHCWEEQAGVIGQSRAL